MKSFLLSSLLLSSLSFASDFATVEVGRQAHAFKINSVSTQFVGTRSPFVQVFANATFGNRCEVPLSDELVRIVQHSKNFNNLIVSVGSLSDRACPAVYAPVTVTIDLGTFTRPNDGNFSKVIVNGITAR